MDTASIRARMPVFPKYQGVVCEIRDGVFVAAVQIHADLLGMFSLSGGRRGGELVWLGNGEHADPLEALAEAETQAERWTSANSSKQYIRKRDEPVSQEQAEPAPQDTAKSQQEGSDPGEKSGSNPES